MTGNAEVIHARYEQMVARSLDPDTPMTAWPIGHLWRVHAQDCRCREGAPHSYCLHTRLVLADALRASLNLVLDDFAQQLAQGDDREAIKQRWGLR